VLGETKGKIVVGYDADLVIWESVFVSQASVATVKTSTFEKCVITGAINYIKS
jgi:predicted amidohydrolase YtcJ